MSDLVDKVRWLRAHDDLARRIGEAGRELAETATYEREVNLSSAAITAAMQERPGITVTRGDLRE